MKRTVLRRKSLIKRVKLREVSIFRVKVLKTTTADNYFSKEILARDPMCRRCKTVPSNDNSHYWLRKHSGTRFDLQNCIGLCRPCHDYWEHEKNEEYKEFMLAWLGRQEYDLLESRARRYKNRRDAVLEFMARRNSLT